MADVIGRRLLQLVPILLGLSVLLFVWVRALPGDASGALLAPDSSVAVDAPSGPQEAQEIRRLYGLDRPVHRQYLTWMGRALRLDLGKSLVTHQDVTAELMRRFPATIELTAAALVFAVGLGVPFGLFAARRQASWMDRVSLTSALVAISVPTFVLAFLLKYVFSVQLGWLPTAGRLDVTRDLAHPTGFFLLDAVLALDGAALADGLRHLLLPAVALGTPSMAVIARITRASVLDVANEDYVRTARAKGLSEPRVSRRHVLRTALMPVATLVGLVSGALLSGAVLVEIVFSWGGMGTFLQRAVLDRDYPVLQGGILFVAVVFILVNLVVDLAYAWLDPRARVR